MCERIQTIMAYHECRNFGTRENLRTAQQDVAAVYRSLTNDECNRELTEIGARRGLILSKCHPLVSPGHPDGVSGIVRINAPSDSSCGWCGRRMTALFDFDLTSEMLAFLGITGTQLRIETCDVCTCYGFVLTKVDGDGGSSWHPANERPEYPISERRIAASLHGTGRM